MTLQCLICNKVLDQLVKNKKYIWLAGKKIWMSPSGYNIFPGIPGSDSKGYKFGILTFFDISHELSQNNSVKMSVLTLDIP